MSQLEELVPAEAPPASAAVRPGLPFTFAQQHGVILDATDDGSTLVVHVEEPKVDVLTELRRLLGASFTLQSVPESDFKRRLTLAYQRNNNEAVQMAEEAFTTELAKVVSHLTERLAGQDDGKPKVFRDSAVENLVEFFDRFRHLNLGSDGQLDELVDQAQRVVRGVQPQELRDNQTLRQYVATELSAVQSVLDGLLVDRPRRNILRRPK